MSCKYTLSYLRNGKEKHFLIEDFDDAIFCEGRVFLRETVEHCINTAPGQCWGAYVDAPAGSFLDGEMLSRPMQLCIDDVGQSFVITEIVSTAPLSIRSCRHVCVAYPSEGEQEKNSHCKIAKLETKRNYDTLIVNGFSGDASTLLIPAELDGFSVRRVQLMCCDFSNVETLIISKGIDELAIDFSGARKLSRLIIPQDISLMRPLDNICETAWFDSQPPEPIYISGCYCGTPGGGSGGVRSLVIPEGIYYIAAGADFHSYWHSIKTPESLCRIGALAFATNHCLEELNLSEGLKRIDTGAFYQSDRLKSLYLPDSLITLGKDCFKKAMFLQDVSVGKEKFAERFQVHKLTIRTPNGDKHLSLCPPIAVPLTDRIRSYTKGSGFIVGSKSYKNLHELTSHPMQDPPWAFLDVHGREIRSIAVLDRCRPTGDGGYECVQRWFYKENSCISQIEQVEADGTILVREGIGVLDVPYIMRDLAAELFDK